MKTLKSIFETVNTEFPDIKDFKTKSGITSIRWYCGNEACKEYLQNSLSGCVYVGTRPWFDRNWDKMNNISISIYKRSEEITSNIYFNFAEIGGRAVQFEGQFKSVREAKTKMYELLCKIKDEKDIFEKMRVVLNANPDKSYFMGYDEFMSL